MLSFAIAASTAHAGPTLQLSSTTIVAESCPPGNGAVDPYEHITLNLVLLNTGDASTTNLTATLLSGSGVYFPSGPKVLGAIVPSGLSVAVPFSMSITGACGSTVVANWSLSDNGTPLGVVSQTFLVGAPIVITNSFTQPVPLLLDENFAVVAAPYPSTIAVSGITNPIQSVSVTLNDLTHTWPRDLDILVSGPGGQGVLLAAGAGADYDVVHANITFDDASTTPLPEWDPIVSDTYHPTVFRNYPLPAPAPAPPLPSGAYPLQLNSLLAGGVNGDWSLWVNDTELFDGGLIEGGWTVNFFSAGVNCCDRSAEDDDRDGCNNADEARAGTNPVDSHSRLRISSVVDSGTNILVSFPSVVGRTYAMERTTLPSVTNWVTIASALAGNDGHLTVTDSTGHSLNQCLYRVRLTSP